MGKRKEANNKYHCKLMPYKRTDVLSAQEAKQNAGWSITAFNLPEIWQHVQGEGVTIAIVDTGVDDKHTDLSDNLIDGYNVIKPGTKPFDDAGHGTHVAGVIAAQNNAIGIVGVAPKAKIMPIKVLDKNGNGNLLHVATGIRWAADHGADFISMSLGSPAPLQQVRKAIQYAANKGVVTFVAAGNAGLTKSIFYPANYKETISIGSIDENFDRSRFSNTGDNLDFMAPGGKILSTVPPNWYAIMSGTSMACPFAVGVAALILSYCRARKGKCPKTADEYRALFRQHTTPIKDKNYAGKQFFQGFGIIDPRTFQEWVEKNT